MKKDKLLLTVTLNPSIDQSIELERFRYGEMNRISESIKNLAGKGYHVAITNKRLGGDSFCLGFSFKHSRMLTEKYFLTNGVANEFVEIPGELRVNLKIFDRETSIITEINDKGKPVDEGQLETLFSLVKSYLKVGDMIVFSGSVQPGIPDTVYKDLISEAKIAGLKTVLDAEGTLLTKGLESIPYFIKPNLYELEKSFGKIVTNFHEAAEMCRYFTEMGIRIVCISMGSRGAVISDGTETYSAKAPDIEIMSTVGAGDSMIGAICNSILAKKGLPEMLKTGIAASCATSMKKGNDICSIDDYSALLGQVEIEKM